MVRRASEGTGEAAYQRLARRTEEAQAEANARVEQMFDTMLDEVRGLRGEIRGVDQRGEQRSAATERRLSELELQINMTRDEVQRRAVHPAPSQIASAKKAIRDTAKSPAGVVVAACIFVTTLTAAGGGIPKLIQGAERFWAFLAGREIPAIARPLVEPPAKVPEK